MGASFGTYVVVGVRVADVLQIGQTTRTETKYDADTGKPFKKVTSQWVATLFGKERSGLEPNPTDWEYSKLVKQPSVLPEGLIVFNTGNDASTYGDDRRRDANPYAAYDYTKHVIGVRLNVPPGDATYAETPKVWSASFDDLCLAFSQARTAFEAAGYHGALKLYTVSAVSY